MILTFNTHIPSLTQSVVCVYQISGHRLQYFSEKNSLFSLFSKEKLKLQFDLAVKWVMVNQGSSFEQTMMGWSPRCYIPSFVEIGPLVPEKTFDRILP